MKQIFNTNLGIKVKEAPSPSPGKNEVQIDVVNSLVSIGTETISMKNKNLNEKFDDSVKKLNKLIDLIKKGSVKKVLEKLNKAVDDINHINKHYPIGYSNS